MKKLFTLLSFLLSFAVQAQTPSTITQNDLPSVGDTIRLSYSNQLSSVNFTQTGANFNWNFNFLIPSSQSVEKFVNLNTTPTIYQFFFNNPLNPASRATMANPQNRTDTIAGIVVRDLTTFINKSSTQYKVVGLGATINGNQVPITYNNHDIVYRFPVAYNNRDSANSDFVINLPGMIYLAENQKRVNRVDGWGTLTTPFGTFNTIRVVSKLDIKDSVKLDSMQGFTIFRTMKEYKWLASNIKVPVLQITTEMMGPTEIVRSISYRDIYRNLNPLAVKQDNTLDHAIFIYPNPLTSDNIIIKLPEEDRSNPNFKITDITGKVLFEQKFTHSPSSLYQIDSKVLESKKGIFLIQIEHSQGIAVKRIVKN